MGANDRRSAEADPTPAKLPASPIADALFGKTRRLVLALLYAHPEQAYHPRYMARLLGTGEGALHRELRNLTNAGLLIRERSGRQVTYQANPESPVYADLRGLVIKTVGLADVVRASLAPLEDRTEVAFIYGSVARGSDDVRSDVDVMVIGEAHFADVVAALAPAQEALQRDVNPTLYPQDEFSTKVRQGHHFLTSVLREPKIYLIGGPDDLGRLAGQRVAD